jgi:hypothetical protein
MVGQPRPPFPSAPSEPSLRRLGTAGSGNSDRPIKAQLIVALVALVILLAVPLYLWRRPTVRTKAVDAGLSVASASASAPPASASMQPPSPFQPEHARTNPLQRVKCGASRTRASSGMTCDALPALEHAFVDAIQRTFDCAPKTTKDGSINHVLEVDFARKTLHVFPGKSGEWHGPSARRTTKCVERALGKPDFSAMPHAHAYYALAVLANYPSSSASGQAMNLSTPPNQGGVTPGSPPVASANGFSNLPAVPVNRDGTAPGH